MARLYSQHWKDYELLDAGAGKKLERWGDVITIRPERNAYFRSIWPFDKWSAKADFEFIEENSTKGIWKQLRPAAAESWSIAYQKIELNLQLTKYKHLGLFPEQQINWHHIEKNTKKGDRFLNLFGYTGAASLIARASGAEVFHCDSVKQVINWGKKNMESSGLADIRWVLEDAFKFAQREVKRGNRYDGISMDPPSFGIGANKQRWKIENSFSELLKLALNLRTDGGYIIVNTYSPKLHVKKVIGIATDLVTRESVGVDTLCLKSTTQKIIEYGIRTLITA